MAQSDDRFPPSTSAGIRRQVSAGLLTDLKVLKRADFMVTKTTLISGTRLFDGLRNGQTQDFRKVAAGAELTFLTFQRSKAGLRDSYSTAF